jgi:hypothetical protein
MSWQVNCDELTMRREERHDGVPRLPSVPDPVQEHERRSDSQPLIGQPHVTPLSPEWFPAPAVAFLPAALALTP